MSVLSRIPFSRAIVATLLLAGTAVAATPAAADPTAADSVATAAITEVTGFGTNPGALRMYRYRPDGLPTGRPAVLALHGCTQDAAAYGTDTGWVALAEQWRFTLVLPAQQQANNGSRCFNWFQSADTTRGQGEAESIAQMVRRAVADGADPARVWISGLSAGGGMTATMLATYPEMFAGGGIVAGPPHHCATTLIEAYSCMYPGRNLTPAQWGGFVRAASQHTGPWPTVSIWHGTADYTVATANQREQVDQWTNVHGIPTTPSATDTVAGFPHAVYRTADGRTVVETVTLTGMGHGQPVDPGTAATSCGRAGAYILDVNLCAARHLGTTWQLAG